MEKPCDKSRQNKDGASGNNIRNLYMKLIWVDILGNSIEYGVNEIQTVACFSKNRFAERNNAHNQFYNQFPVDDFEQIVSYILSHSINHIDRKKEVVA